MGTEEIHCAKLGFFDSDIKRVSMSESNSPSYSVESDRFFDPNFTAEISQKMRVPKRINVDGVSDMPNMNRSESHWMPAEKLDMHVPERIVVAGQETHFGTKALPREIVLDNTIIPSDPGVRVQTPPRVITIDSNYYHDDYQPSPIFSMPPRKQDMDRRFDMSHVNNNSVNLNDSVASVEGMTLNEEVVHLRRQLAKLNRRVMTVELDNLQRQNRDKIVYALGLAYFFFKTFIWLSRSS
ncbi:transport and Golgi organization protein 11 isoform X2 [Cimex lectularius]|uniref:Mff-like domain-containing protein n=2 Tax=Cimex lectularius TaxID=79782 RepID=A0A8I6S909_CIMLE|nr:transport and Golgi organization protein 11 isoform X2 [Cimex lectularius]